MPFFQALSWRRSGVNGISPVLVIVLALIAYPAFALLRRRAERFQTAKETEEALDEADRLQR